MKKSLIFLSLIITLTLCEPKVKTWPLNELYDAIMQYPSDSLTWILANEAVYFIYDHIIRDHTEEFGHVVMPSPSGAEVWTRDELVHVVENIAIYPVFGFYAQAALERLSNKNTAPLLVPAMDISTWTASDVLDALKDRATNPALLPYLNEAKKKFKGNVKEVNLVTPIGLVQVKNEQNYPPGYEYVFQSIYVTV